MNFSSRELILFLIVTIVPSAVISLVSVFVVRKNATRLGLIDQPGHRKVHTQPVPLGGGIGIWAGVILTFLLGTIAAFAIRGNPALQEMLPATVGETLMA